MKRINTIEYVYRGQVERGSKFQCRDAYSITTLSGLVCYPWMTKRECQADARKRGLKAVFKRGVGA